MLRGLVRYSKRFSSSVNSEYIFVKPKEELLQSKASIVADNLGLKLLGVNQELPNTVSGHVILIGSDRIQLDYYVNLKNKKTGIREMSKLKVYFTDFEKYYSGLPSLERRSPLLRAMMEGMNINNNSDSNEMLQLNGMNIIDGTAGLGQDSFLLAKAGANVEMVESHPIVHLLLKDGLVRAQQSDNTELCEIMKRISLLDVMDCEDLFDKMIADNTCAKPDCVYLDPIPHHKKKTHIRKPGTQLSLPRTIVNSPNREKQERLLEKAREIAAHNVVIKRPYYADIDPNAYRTYKSVSWRCDSYLRHGTK